MIPKVCIVCNVCNRRFEREARSYRRGLKLNTKYWYCSKECSHRDRSRLSSEAKTSSDPLIRFWSKVDKKPGLGPDGTCWEWTSSLKDGYGNFRVSRNRTTSAHIYSYEIHKGKRNNLFVCHSCDNRKCVNPDHLWLGTIQDNVKDMMNKKRQAIGQSIHSTKLTQEIAYFIKFQRGNMTNKEIADIVNVLPCTISQVKNGRQWSYVAKETDLRNLKL